MTGPALTVRGADRLARTLDGAARDLEDLTATNRAVANTVAGAADPPVLTGRLAASITATGDATTATVSSDVIYAGVQERRYGYLAAAMTSKTPAAVNLYAGAVDDALRNVKGV